MADATPQEKATALIAMLRDKGQGDYIGEAISQLAHSLQAAHQAAQADSDDETILAALLHDIGQFLPAQDVRALAHDVRCLGSADSDADVDDVGRVGHEKIGEEYLLRLGFSQKVGFLVGSHVLAKRFLCAVEPSYHAGLSTASKKSLVFQGGPMNEDEVACWRQSPFREEMCRLRRYDDQAKVVGLEVPGVESYEDMIVRHLSRASA